MIDGAPVSSANQGARAVPEELIGPAPGLRPEELGLPWADLAALPGVFTDEGHQNHLHVSAPPDH